MSQIAKKVASIINDIQQPEQSGENTYDGFEYSTRDDIFRVVKPQLAAHGIAMLVSVETLETVQVGKTNSGKPQFLTRVRVDVKLVDEGENNTLEASWEGEAIDHGGRGVQQAATQAIRFWMTNTFLLTDGSEEAIYQGSPNAGNGQGQVQNVQRQKASSTKQQDSSKLVKKVRDLNFNDQQVEEFKRHIARTYNVASFDQVPAGRIKRWYELMGEKSDAEARQTIMNLIGAQAA